MAKRRRGWGQIILAVILVVLIVLAVFWVFTWHPNIHNVAIARVVPDGVAVPKGLIVDFSVTVANLGSWVESFTANVSLPANASIPVTSQVQSIFDLPVHGEKNIVFPWNTSGLAIGDYPISVVLSPVSNESDLADNMYTTVLSISNRIRLVTSFGNVTIEVFDDTPITSMNFKNLTWLGYYDETKFHRIFPDFVIQGGDTTTGGHPAVGAIRDELPNKHNNTVGMVAMAKTSEPNSATSQFFINLKDNREALDGNYTVFGQVKSTGERGLIFNEVSRLQRDNLLEDNGSDEVSKPTVDVTLVKAVFVK